MQTDEQYVEELIAKRNGFEQRLEDIMFSDAPERVKQARIRLVRAEMHALLTEIKMAIESLKGTAS